MTCGWMGRIYLFIYTTIAVIIIIIVGLILLNQILLWDGAWA